MKVKPKTWIYIKDEMPAEDVPINLAIIRLASKSVYVQVGAQLVNGEWLLIPPWLYLNTDSERPYAWQYAEPPAFVPYD